MICPLDLFSEHLLQDSQDRRRRGGRQTAKTLHQPLAVHRAKLIQYDEARLALKPTPDTPRVRVPSGCQGCHDDRLKMQVQFVRGHHEARSRLANLAARGGIQEDQMNIAPQRGRACYRHCHSFRSNFVAVGASSSSSSPRARWTLAASPQPARGPRAARTTKRPRSACSSTSSGSRACSSSPFGTRMPRELPMRTIRVFVIM